MNNFIIGFKRFITNKNVVTILGVLVVLGILYWGYSSTIKKSTAPISIPVAAKTINSLTEITSEDVTYVNVAGSMVNDKVIRNSGLLIGKYTNINVTIPEGSMFYSEWITEAENVPGNWIEQLDYEKEELGYYMSISSEDTLGNCILPNSYIDIYMMANDENGAPMFGKLMANIKVLVVHDGSGHNAFENGNSITTPSKIGFAVSKDLYILFKKAEYLGIDLTIVPRGLTVPETDAIVVTSSTLRDYIDAKTITVQEDVILSQPEETTENEDAKKEESKKDNKKTTSEENSQG